MNNSAVAFATLTLTAMLALGGCAVTTSGTDMPGMNHGDGPAAMTDAVANQADIMFATMMIPHHEQAIEMSDMLLGKNGVDPEVVALAERIKAAQRPEITQMETWLDEWGAHPADMGGMDHGSGMMSDESMQALEAANGAEASRLFLEQMIVHHEGAIEMAEAEVENGEDPEAIALAEKIIADQTAEIAEMRQLLSEL